MAGSMARGCEVLARLRRAHTRVRAVCAPRANRLYSETEDHQRSPSSSRRQQDRPFVAGRKCDEEHVRRQDSSQGRPGDGAS